MNPNNIVTDKEIDKLLELSQVHDTALVAEAAEKTAKTARERRILAVQTYLGTIETDLNANVNILRTRRTQEKEQRAVVSKLATAKAEFIKTGNIRPFAKAKYPSDMYSEDQYVTNYLAAIK